MKPLENDADKTPGFGQNFGYLCLLLETKLTFYLWCLKR